jgi:hypothetical protein
MLDRRRFVGATLAGGVGLTLGSGCSEPNEPSAEGGSSPVQPFELDEISVAELQESRSPERAPRAPSPSCTMAA